MTNLKIYYFEKIIFSVWWRINKFQSSYYVNYVYRVGNQILNYSKRYHDTSKKRYYDNVKSLQTAVALAIPHERAIELSKPLIIFESVQAYLKKIDTNSTGKTQSEIRHAIRQLVDQSLAAADIVDIFEAEGVRKPEIGILSQEFLEDIQKLKNKNLVFEALKKLIGDQIKSRSKVNLTQSVIISERLQQILNQYNNNLLSSAEVIDQLIQMSKDIIKADKEGKESGLTDYELAFYDALSQNESAKKVMGEEKLRELALVLVEQIKSNRSIDWYNRSDVQAKMRLAVKKVLRKYSYPPDLEQLAIDRILDQTKVTLENS